ncbi:MAG: LysE/ArgO family amino acid transporter [Actinobacteria bacterium]|nr:LysE/ArgO family amino acid transporter [Actinomycetota bacterium]MDA2981779.1 LysE/ArgO family amino acid transporter [Actinomycetota bacterium]MDA2996787.1 LysE/ArgO family amino acid transporter [Actinomycetota bacterium]
MIAIVPGFLAGLSLIIAIGAQNTFVIRQGLTKKFVLLTVLICACSDALLIALGASGLGALIKSNKDLLEFVRWFGVAYLLWFAFKSARSAFKQEVLNSAGEASANKKGVVLTVLALTFLNPHVYLDTVILLGSISNQFGSDKWFFVTGAIIASFLWFTSIGFGAKSASRFMSRPIFWKILDSLIAAIMLSIAAFLAFYNFN